VKFDKNDSASVDFVYATANLLAFAFDVKEKLGDKATVAKIADDIIVPEFTPKKKEIKENQPDTGADDDDVVIAAIRKDLLEIAAKKSITGKLQYTQFEKDDDRNHHIDFISGVANLRARNYRIHEVDRSKVKFIAGKIIPAIATTTAMVVGAVGFEYIKFVLEKDVKEVRNLFANLGLPLWLFSETYPPTKNVDKEYDVVAMGPVKAIPNGWTTWDSIKIEGPKTLAEIVEFLKHKYALKLSLITCNKQNLYSTYGGPEQKKKNEEYLKKTPEELHELAFGEPFPKDKKYLDTLGWSFSMEDDTDAITPRVVYVRKVWD